ncbi:MAG: STAS-like domain-containing protein [Candidatus Moraniibacteriota bacterium]|nr:MAG: STAS-like domain-containing protein [Candidatus Moranbacteria bacterium]
MKIELKKFGEMLVSRPAGKEAYLVLAAYTLPEIKKNEKVEIDFSGVKVLTPSWADEVLTPLRKQFPSSIFVSTINPTVQMTLKTLEEYSFKK